MSETLDELQLKFRGDAQLLPYMVFSAGRSRTMWLSAFLTYGICVCNFEATAKVSSLQEVLTMLSIPGMGAAETLAAPAWPLLLTAEPRLRTVVVRRPIDEILASLVAATEKDHLELDLPRLRHLLEYVRRALDKLALQPQTLTVDFHELAQESVCAAIFEHCLPYKHDSGWWEFLSEKNLNPDVRQLATLYQQRQNEILGLGKECRHMMFKLGRQGYFKHLATNAAPEALQ
jgi:hypothetical protein